MATTDSELIAEARALTNYTQSMLSDSTFQELVDIGKEELRAEMDKPNFSFYQTGGEHTLQADRALFWFTCIAAKIKGGEIGGIDIDLGDISTNQPDEEEYAVWFSQFRKRLDAAVASETDTGGPGQTSLQRDDRTYGDSFDTSVREPEL